MKTKVKKKHACVEKWSFSNTNASRCDTKLPITLKLPWAPSANAIWRNLRSGQVYLSPQYRTFLNESYYLFLSQGKPRVARGELLQITLLLFPPHRRAYDIDNRIKPTLDALTKIGFWKDDRYVRKITVIANEPVEGGAIIIEVDSFNNQQEEYSSQALLTWYGLERLENTKLNRKENNDQRNEIR